MPLGPPPYAPSVYTVPTSSPTSREGVLIARMGLIVALHHDLQYRSAVSQLRRLEEDFLSPNFTYHKDVWAASYRMSPILQNLFQETSLVEASLYQGLLAFISDCDSQRSEARKKAMEVLEEAFEMDQVVRAEALVTG